MKTIVLLSLSNIFMTFAWYGHLKFKQSPLWKVILASWAIAFVEYCFQVPANRIGHYQYSAAQLKTMQEVVTLVVFSIFSVVYLKRGASLELPFGIWIDGGCGLCHLQGMVSRWVARAFSPCAPIPIHGITVTASWRLEGRRCA